MILKELIKKNRTCRRFHQEVAMERSLLEEMIDLARLSASAANLQPLKYFIANDPPTNSIIFPHLGWAGYLKNWPGPVEGERPAAYIIVLLDKTICRSVDCDHGIAAQSILLGAVEKGFAGCIIASVKRDKVAEALQIPAQYEILFTIALGKPKESVAIETIAQGDDIKYWRDNYGVHHVPKRSLGDIIINQSPHLHE